MSIEFASSRLHSFAVLWLNFPLKLVIKCTLQCSGPRKTFIQKVQPVVIIYFTGSLISKTEAPCASKKQKKPPGKWNHLRFNRWCSFYVYQPSRTDSAYYEVKSVISAKIIWRWLYRFFVVHNRFVLCVRVSFIPLDFFDCTITVPL